MSVPTPTTNGPDGHARRRRASERRCAERAVVAGARCSLDFHLSRKFPPHLPPPRRRPASTGIQARRRQDAADGQRHQGWYISTNHSTLAPRPTPPTPARSRYHPHRRLLLDATPLTLPPPSTHTHGTARAFPLSQRRSNKYGMALLAMALSFTIITTSIASSGLLAAASTGVATAATNEELQVTNRTW